MYQARLWTFKEEDVLRSLYGKFPNKDLIVKLFEVKTDYIRSVSAITKKAFSLDLTKHKDSFIWSEIEVNFLKNNYGKLSILEIAKRLDRTKTSISSKINLLNLTDSDYYKKYTFDDILLLKDISLSGKDLSIKLNRTVCSIHNKRRRLKIKIYKQYSEKEIKYIFNNYETTTIKELSIKLNRDIQSINYKLRELKLIDKVKKLDYKKWSIDELSILDDLLKDNINYIDISTYLNRTYRSIVKSVHLHFPNYVRRNKKWSTHEDKFLLDNPKMFNKEIASILGFTYTTIISHQRRLKIIPLYSGRKRK